MIESFRTDTKVLTDYVDNFTELEKITYGHFIKSVIEEEINKLPKHCKIIIQMRFGLDDGVPKTLNEIGEKIGITASRVRQIEAYALHKLKRSQLIKLANVQELIKGLMYHTNTRQFQEAEDYILDEEDYTGKYKQEDYDYEGLNKKISTVDPLEEDYVEFGFSPKSL